MKLSRFDLTVCIARDAQIISIHLLVTMVLGSNRCVSVHVVQVLYSQSQFPKLLASKAT